MYRLCYNCEAVENFGSCKRLILYVMVTFMMIPKMYDFHQNNVGTIIYKPKMKLAKIFCSYQL